MKLNLDVKSIDVIRGYGYDRVVIRLNGSIHKDNCLYFNCEEGKAEEFLKTIVDGELDCKLNVFKIK
jgi:hypothetical protein